MERRRTITYLSIQRACKFTSHLLTKSSRAEIWVQVGEPLQYAHTETYTLFAGSALPT